MSVADFRTTGGASPVPTEGVLIHDVSMQAQPRILDVGRARRTMRSPETSSSAASPKAGATAGMGLARRAAVPVPDVDPRTTDLYKEGFLKGHEKGGQDVLDAVRQHAFEEGLRQGIEQGRAQGREEAEHSVQREMAQDRKALAARIELLDGWIADFPSQLERVLEERLLANEDDLVSLSHAVICRLLGDHALESNVIESCVRTAITECCGAGADGSAKELLAVRLHPADLASLASGAALAEWLEGQGAKGVRWLSDARVVMGGCIVESSLGSLDAQLETQLAALQATLRRKREPNASSPVTEKADNALTEGAVDQSPSPPSIRPKGGAHG